MSKRLVWDYGPSCNQCAQCAARIERAGRINTTLIEYAPKIEAAYVQWNGDRLHATYMRQYQQWSTSAVVAAGDNEERSRRALCALKSELDSKLDDLCSLPISICAYRTLKARITEDCTDEGQVLP